MVVIWRRLRLQALHHGDLLDKHLGTSLRLGRTVPHNWASHGDQFREKNFSTSSVSVPFQRFLPWVLSLTYHYGGQSAGHASWNQPLAPPTQVTLNYSLYHSSRKQTKVLLQKVPSIPSHQGSPNKNDFEISAILSHNWVDNVCFIWIWVHRSGITEGPRRGLISKEKR